MAEIVAGIGVPHTPVFPALVERKGPDCEEARLYGEVERFLSEARADAMLIFSNDHFNTFFFDNFPLFAIGVAEATCGPNDQTPMPSYDVPVHEKLAGHLRAGAIRAGYDIAITQEFTLDHAFMVPWHFINARLKLPIVPFFIDGFSDPLPSARRVWQMGEALREAIGQFLAPSGSSPSAAAASRWRSAARSPTGANVRARPTAPGPRTCKSACRPANTIF